MRTGWLWGMGFIGCAAAGAWVGRTTAPDLRGRLAAFEKRAAELEASLRKQGEEKERLQNRILFLEPFLSAVSPESMEGSRRERDVPGRTAGAQALADKGEAALKENDLEALAAVIMELLDGGPASYEDLMILLDRAKDAGVQGLEARLLPELEKRLQAMLEENPSEALRVAWMIGELGGRSAMETLWRSAEGAGEDVLRHQLVGIIGRMTDVDVSAFLGGKLEAPQDSIVRQALLFSMAQRPGGLDRLASFLNTQGLDSQERYSIVGGIVNRCLEDPGASAAIWDLAERASPDGRDLFISALVRAGDARAQDLAIERLRAGNVAPGETGWDRMREEADLWGHMRTEKVRENESLFREAAGNMSFPPFVRTGFAKALAKVDRRGAVDSLMQGFASQREHERLQTVYALKSLGLREVSSALDSIAASDPSPQIRQAAR